MLSLTRSEFKALSQVFIAAGQVFFAAFVAGIAVLTLDPLKLFVLLLELIFSIFSWYLSVAFARKGRL